MGRLDGKVVLVTGAGSGMGAACADHAASEGARVYGLDRDGERLAEVVERIGAKSEVGDLTELDARAVVGRCVTELGGLDGLVNAAGIFQPSPLLEITEELFDRTFAVNVRALFFLQQAAAASMVDRSTGGSIVNFASTAARVPRPITSHYAASKAAVVSLSMSAGAALGKQGIRVNAICPGVVETPMVEKGHEEMARLLGEASGEELEAGLRSAHPLGRFGQPREIAQMVTFLLSDEASYVNGESIGVSGGTNDL